MARTWGYCALCICSGNICHLKQFQRQPICNIYTKVPHIYSRIFKSAGWRRWEEEKKNYYLFLRIVSGAACNVLILLVVDHLGEDFRGKFWEALFWTDFIQNYSLNLKNEASDFYCLIFPCLCAFYCIFKGRSKCANLIWINYITCSCPSQLILVHPCFIII